MIILPNEQGWAFDESTAWKLVYDGSTIIFFDETEKAISTQSALFVGTKDECDAEIARLGLVDVSAQGNDNGLDIHADSGEGTN
jgi:hypothetical protein